MVVDFTGERFIPSLTGQMKYEHLHRYAISMEFVAGKAVLDLACGEGYGSALLATAATSVTGVDIDPKTIAHAKQQYRDYKNLEFLVGSCDAVPLPAKSADVVVSFETIEHHDKHHEMMLEIKRILRPDGVLILSSPNRLTYSDEPKYANPFHVKELYLDELIDLLQQHFKYVQVYGQRAAVGSFIFPLQDSNKITLQSHTTTASSIEKRSSRLNAPIYFIALCSDQDFDEEQQLLGSVFTDSTEDFLHSLQSQLHHAQLKLDQTKSVVSSMQNSKFWKLRAQCLKLRKLMGFAVNAE